MSRGYGWTERQRAAYERHAALALEAARERQRRREFGRWLLDEEWRETDRAVERQLEAAHEAQSDD